MIASNIRYSFLAMDVLRSRATGICLERSPPAKRSGYLSTSGFQFAMPVWAGSPAP